MIGEEKLNYQTWLVMRKLREINALSNETDLKYEIDPKSSIEDFPSALDQMKIIGQLEKIGVLKVIPKAPAFPTTRNAAAIHTDIYSREKNAFVKGFYVEILPKFNELYEQSSFIENDPNGSYRIRIKDRQIWINNYYLSKPYAAGSRLLFFETLYEKAGKQIERKDLPLHVREEITGQNFIKILNGLGFKGEILKSFFPKRSKSSATLRKAVSKTELIQEGINLQLLERELAAAHSKNVPD